MEPPSQVKSNQLTGVPSDDPLSRLCILSRKNPQPQGLTGGFVVSL